MKRKLLIVQVLILIAGCSYAQWTRVQQLPSSDIFSLYHKDSILYAGGKNIVYISRNKGQSWDSTSFIPGLSFVDNIIVYRNELYASSYSNGVYKSPDQGVTWTNIISGLFPFVSDVCEFRGNLYAATLGNAVYKLDPVSRNHWISFQSGLSSLSANLSSIAATSNSLVAGTTANALFDYLPSNSTVWQEKFLLDQIHPTEGAYDIVTAHDTLFYAGFTGKFYISTDNGQNWNFFGNPLPSNNTTLVNARQALLSSRSIFNGVNYTTFFDYIKKDSLQSPFVPFSFVQDHFTYKTDILGDKLWDASTRGLFYMSLSDLPGITAADDSVQNIPVSFTFLNTTCGQNKIIIDWKTAQEQNSSHFNIERTNDNIHWTVIGSVAAAGNSATEKNYSFTDNDPVPDILYRIAEYDLNGRVYYTGLIGTPCAVADKVKLGPNPSHDMTVISITANNESQASISMFDSKGALIRRQNSPIVIGSNQVILDLRSLSNGVYYFSIEWNNGLQKQIIPFLKQ